jgi:MFS family permease
MAYPLLQAFVAMIMAAHTALLGPALGVIEGIAESTSSILKVFAGYYSDKVSNRKVPAIAGYAFSAMAKLLLLAASVGWWFVLLSRFFDRIGKGVRSAPRDALIAESTPPQFRGRAFGLQRSMDFAGAFCGVALCYFLVRHYLDPATATLKNTGDFIRIFVISIIPAFLGVGVLFFLRETAKPPASQGKAARPDFNLRNYDKNLRVFFLVQLLFTLGNSSNQFLLLRSMNLGFSLSTVILMYMLFNLTSASLGTLFGSLSDKIGKKRVLACGYGLYGIVYGAFGLLTPQTSHLLWGFWALYGIFYALTEGVEKAFVAQLAPAQSKATALGFSHTIVGVCLLPASLIAGALFAVSPQAPFLFGSLTSLIAVYVLVTRISLSPSGEARRDA